MDTDTLQIEIIPPRASVQEIAVYKRPHRMGRKPNRWKRYFENSYPAPQVVVSDVYRLISAQSHRWSATPVNKQDFLVYKND